MKKIAAQIQFALLLLITALLARPTSAQDPQQNVYPRWKISTGSESGAYYQIVERLIKKQQDKKGMGEANIAGYSLENLSSEGSVDNIKRLIEGKVDFAIVQQDVAYKFHLDSKTEDRFRVVDRLLYDYLHILVRRPLHLEEVRWLAGKRLWLGPQGSGTRQTAQRFLDIIGLSPVEFTDVPLPDSVDENNAEKKQGEEKKLRGLDRFLQSVKNRQIDAGFMLVAPGMNKKLHAALDSGQLGLVALDHRLRRLFSFEENNAMFDEEKSNGNESGTQASKSSNGDTKEKLASSQRNEKGHGQTYGQMFVDHIPAHTYPGQTSDLSTMVVPVLLLVRTSHPGKPDISDEDALKVGGALKEQWLHLQKEVQGENLANPINPPDLQTSHLKVIKNSPGLAEWNRAHFWSNVQTLLAIAALTIGLIVLLRSRKWRRFMRKHTGNHLTAVIISVITGILVVTICTWWFEHEHNEHFQSLYESFWSITVYLFSGLEDRAPYSTPGRITATIGLILGPVLFATTTAWMAAKYLNWEKQMPQKLEDHYLILNWHQRAIEVIKQIHHPIMETSGGKAVIVILTDDVKVNIDTLKRTGFGVDTDFEDVFFSIGDPTEESALLNANAQDANSILVIANEDDPIADERTIRSVFMISEIAKKKERKDLHVVAELMNPANVAVVNGMARDFPGLLETVARGETRTHLLAQATINKGLIGLYKNLLSVSPDTNEVYIHKVPQSAIGKTFHQYSMEILDYSRTKGQDGSNQGQQPLIAIGVQRVEDGRETIICNPQLDRVPVLEEGDSVVVLAYKQPKEDEFPQ